MRRAWEAPTDRVGPRTQPRPVLTRKGVGARLVMRGNPVSFTTDWLSECAPFLSLAGGQDAASVQARRALAQGDAFAASGLGAADPKTPSTSTTPTPATGGSSTGTTAGSSPGSTPKPPSGPFAYIGLADSKKG